MHLAGGLPSGRWVAPWRVWHCIVHLSIWHKIMEKKWNQEKELFFKHEADNPYACCVTRISIFSLKSQKNLLKLPNMSKALCHTKSLHKSHRKPFLWNRIEYEIWTNFGQVGNTEKKKTIGGRLWAAFRHVFSCFCGPPILRNSWYIWRKLKINKKLVTTQIKNQFSVTKYVYVLTQF